MDNDENITFTMAEVITEQSKLDLYSPPQIGCFINEVTANQIKFVWIR